MIIKNGRVFLGKLVEADIECENGLIKNIAKNIRGQGYNAQGKIVLPGVIDAHVHFRVPGGEHKEDWVTGSRSAVKGGVTTVFDMPNTSPPTTSIRTLEQKRLMVKGKSLVNYGFYFGASKDNTEDIKKVENVPGIKVYMASTTGNLLVEDDESIKKVFEAVKSIDQLAFCHAENEELLQKAIQKAKDECPRDPLVHCKSRPKQCAWEGARRACEIKKLVGNRMHITHTSTSTEVELAKACGATCDTTTTYLFLEEKDLEEKGNYAKMNPPVRSKSERMKLWEKLKTGQIDFVCTDHAPHTREEKEKDYWRAPAGVPGVQTLVPLLLNEVNRRNLSLKQFVALTSTNPARITRANNKGIIKKGAVADLTIVDMDLEHTFTNEEIESKCGWTPYEGRKVKGMPVATVVNGELAWSGEFGKPRGRELEW